VAGKIAGDRIPARRVPAATEQAGQPDRLTTSRSEKSQWTGPAEKRKKMPKSGELAPATYSWQ